jgi:hypothetical protein
VVRGLHYVTGDERHIDLAHMLEQNYLFPPIDLVERVRSLGRVYPGCMVVWCTRIWCPKGAW